MTAESSPSGDTDELVSRLRVIEDQPLPTRAEAFSGIYRELQESLERADPAKQQ